MLTFLGRIRKGLLGDGATSKYLLYAVGEIALVVIGILIALQINNWNEWKKERETERKYLERMQADLVKDTVYLLDMIKSAVAEQEMNIHFIKTMYEDQNQTSDYIKLISSINWGSPELIFSDKTFSGIVNSGNFDIILNERLADEILDYYRRYNVVAAHISEFNQTGINQGLDQNWLMMKYFDAFSYMIDEEIMHRKSDWAFINEYTSEDFRKFEADVLLYTFKHSVFEDYYRELLKMARELIERIKDELGETE